MCANKIKARYIGYACLRGARMSLIADTALYHLLCLEPNLWQRVLPDIKGELFQMTGTFTQLSRHESGARLIRASGSKE